MKIRWLIWDEWNIEHVLRHGVTQDEIEEVCSSKHFAIKSGKDKMVVLPDTPSILRTIEVRFVQELLESK